MQDIKNDYKYYANLPKVHLKEFTQLMNGLKPATDYNNKRLDYLKKFIDDGSDISTLSTQDQTLAKDYAKLHRYFFDTYAHTFSVFSEPNLRFPPKEIADAAIRLGLCDENNEFIKFTQTPSITSKSIEPSNVKSMDNNNESNNGDMHPNKEKSYLNLIGALANLYWGERYKTSKSPPELTQSTIINNIIEKYPKTRGLSKRTLESNLSKALSYLKESEST
ncbi:MAG: hypothetical protein WAW86_10135 [Gammaproteobacteria bacterium]